MSVTRSRLEGLDALRVRVLRETEQALLYGFEHPDRMQRIPVVQVGKGSFSSTFAKQFWSRTLECAEV